MVQRQQEHQNDAYEEALRALEGSLVVLAGAKPSRRRPRLAGAAAAPGDGGGALRLGRGGAAGRVPG